MAGLLDFLSTPAGQGLLSAGLGVAANAGRGGTWNAIGRGGLMGLQGYQAASEQERLKPMRDMEMQLNLLNLNKAKREASTDQAIQGAAQESFRSPEQAAAMSVGPTQDGGVVNFAPGFDPNMFLQKLQGIDPLKAVDYQQKLRKDNAPISVAAGTSLVDPRTLKPVYTAPKEQEQPSAVREYQFAQGQGYKGSFDQYQKDLKRAGATSLSVNTDNLGLKPKDRFEMEDKLRNDYSKATTDDQAIMTTAADIKNILAQNGALKDQAAIYKFAKALDPQGAVREADYAAIVKTAGGLEYLQNLANKALTGEQLSPGQRKQMADVTAAMARVAEQRIGRQQQTYGKRAKMYNLAPENVFSPAGGKSDEWAIVPPGGR